MQVNVRFLDNLRIEASFDDYTIVSDQPVRYKGDATAPGPFDYFLASSAMCAAYFVKLYCKTRDIPTDDIRITQQNTVDPDNRYQQDLHLQIDLPANLSKKDKAGIIASMERCTVKRVIQNNPSFKIEARNSSSNKDALDYRSYKPSDFRTQIKGKDCTLEETISSMRATLNHLGITIEIASWRNPIPHVWSVHIRDAESPMCYTNGKGATKDAALCSALGEYLERLSTNYFFSDYYLGKTIAESSFVHYPDEKWFPIPDDDEIPLGLMDPYLLNIYGQDQDDKLKASNLIDTNSGNSNRGICALRYIRQSDSEEVFIPINLISNLFVSNGMSAGNTLPEARVQALSEIFERAIKNRIICEEITLPDVPEAVLDQYPAIQEGIKALRDRGFPIIVKDASLGGIYPVACVTLMNPNNGGVFASFGAHPSFEIALERSLTELLQGRSFEGMNDTALPTFNSFAVTEHNNIVDHFIDSTGVVSWKFFSSKSDYDFKHWNFSGTTEEEFNYLMGIFKEINKEVYIADYTDLGATACRIIVPQFSEIYPIEELVWDNNNKPITLRKRILEVHDQSDLELEQLLSDLDECELDDYMSITEFIGVTFDESDAWARLTIGEFKGLIYLAIKDYPSAKNQVDLFLNFNDSTPARRKFYQLLSALIDIELEELEHSHFEHSFTQMYGEALYHDAMNSITGKSKFFGLSKTDDDFKGLKKHLALIESYKKVMLKRESVNEAFNS